MDNQAKIRESNKKIIRALISDVVREATQLGSTVDVLVEQQSTIRNLTARKEEGTYAQVVKKTVERKRSLSRKREESHVALIYPSKEDEGIDSSSFIKESINPIELAIGIKRFQTVIVI